MPQLHLTLHCEPDVGMLLLHWGANIHWGSLTGQMTSSWFDRAIITSMEPFPPPLPSSFTPDRDKIPPKHWITPTAFFLLQYGNRHVSYDVELEGDSRGLAPINSLMNVSLLAIITTTHPLATDSLRGRRNMFLPVPRRWREGTGDSVTGAGCRHTYMHTHTHRQSAIHRYTGYQGICCALWFCFSASATAFRLSEPESGTHVLRSSCIVTVDSCTYRSPLLVANFSVYRLQWY